MGQKKPWAAIKQAKSDLYRLEKRPFELDFSNSRLAFGLPAANSDENLLSLTSVLGRAGYN
jgi:hypothetical protein